MGKIEPQDRDQQEQTAQLREDEELHRGIGPTLVSPDGDQEIHRNQHQLPQEIEQEEIQRNKDAQDAGKDPEQVEVKEADPLFDLGP